MQRDLPSIPPSPTEQIEVCLPKDFSLLILNNCLSSSCSPSLVTLLEANIFNQHLQSNNSSLSSLLQPQSWWAGWAPYSTCQVQLLSEVTTGSVLYSDRYYSKQKHFNPPSPWLRHSRHKHNGKILFLKIWQPNESYLDGRKGHGQKSVPVVSRYSG